MTRALRDWSDVDLLLLYMALERRFISLYEHHDPEERALDVAASRVLTLILTRSAA